MPRKPAFATKCDLLEHKKEVKQMLKKLAKKLAKKDRCEDDKKYQPKRKKAK